MSKPFMSTYIFSCQYNRNGLAAFRSGTVEAQYAYMAMEQVKEMAQDWGHYMEIIIYMTEEDGSRGPQIYSETPGKGREYHSQRPNYNNNQPQPWQFGTAKHFSNYATLKLED